MLSNFDWTHIELIDRVVEHVVDKFPEENIPLIREFLYHYYINVSPEELSTRSVLDLYGASISHWNFIYQRNQDELKVRIYNPQQEQNGWQSSHTIVEVIYNDIPFLVDSIRMAITNLGINIHLIINMIGIKCKRNEKGEIVNIIPLRSDSNDISEAPIYIEIDRQTDKEVIEKIKCKIDEVIADVKIVVKDWRQMRNHVKAIESQNQYTDEEKNFLNWIYDEQFTFLAYAEYKIIKQSTESLLEYVPDTGLGLLNDMHVKSKQRNISLYNQNAVELYNSKQMIMLGKTNNFSTVHRPTYTDFIGIKVFKDNKLVGEKRFIGLYTADAYNSSPTTIPLVREKLQQVYSLCGIDSGRRHDYRNISNILETLPRDELFHSSAEQLQNICLGILHLQERQIVKLFLRKDTFDGYVSCLVFVPRDKFDSRLRERMQDVLMSELQGIDINFTTRFSESTLARIHFIVRIEPGNELTYDIKAIEEKLVEVSRTWKDDLRGALLESCGEETANRLIRIYGDSFPEGYKEAFTARLAVVDIEHIEPLGSMANGKLAMSLYRPIEDKNYTFRFKLFKVGELISLSDVVPILENMGLQIISERPYKLLRKDYCHVWVNDYRMSHQDAKSIDLEIAKQPFQDAFASIWYGYCENDKFNKLVLSANLSWRQVAIIRAYFKYLWQVGIGFSQSNVEDALDKNANISRLLIELFFAKFAPENASGSELVNNLIERIEDSLREVNSLNEDRIIRLFLKVINSTLRTNYFQDNGNKKYFSFKFDCKLVPGLPLPKPMYEIFVYAPELEGIHLRGSKVARGGLRWSDRIDDFRTEVLGLMKAQQVKNSVIVPMGAKGGFVVKKDLSALSNEVKAELVRQCYRVFISGLLDITDNRIGEDVVHPENVVCYDDLDPYLVVAADKGTASFSDIANALAIERKFWLSDAFASGGSAGYDHKKMGITARGAWESVKMHFSSLQHDIQTIPLSVIGIGDLFGDVFGNGMLLSKQIKLIAAFNHQHIFIDPDPDCATSFKERERVFNLERSTWEDYNVDILSPGGGIFSRSEKYIQLTPQIKQLFNITKDSVVPNELIKYILLAKVDLLWNGGIGTFIKSSKESNLEVGDRTNDSIRINANQLRCKVIGEGGNLGLTQLARVEYAQNGGIINTDAIDNSAGVDCSDNEVNIKILLNAVVEKGELTEKQRNQLLHEMQDEVAEIVLQNNRNQNQAITMTEVQAIQDLNMHHRLIKKLEAEANLDRNLEFLPDKEEIASRKAAGKGLTRPEIAVLMAYVKILLKKNLLLSDLPEDEIVLQKLQDAFPTPIKKRYKQFLSSHRLRREIIATRISNEVIDEMGINFIHRLSDETGGTVAGIVRCYIVARGIFDFYAIRASIMALSGNVKSAIIYAMLRDLNRLVRRATRWFLRNRHNSLNIIKEIEHFKPRVEQVRITLPQLLSGELEKTMQDDTKRLNEFGVSLELAQRISTMSIMFSSLDIVEAATENNIPTEKVAKVYFMIGDILELSWFRNQIKSQTVVNHWEALARAAFRDDVDLQQRNLAVLILNCNDLESTEQAIDTWVKLNQDIFNRWQYLISELRSVSPDFTMFAVALRELLYFSQACK